MIERRTRSLRSLSITSKGFGFLLLEVNTQLWDFLLVYLEEAEVRRPFRDSQGGS